MTDAVDTIPNEPLSFSDEKQQALLGHLLENERFFLQASTKLHPEWFKDKIIGRIYRLQLEFLKTYKRVPSKKEVETAPEWLLEEALYRRAIQTKIAQATVVAREIGLDVISKELTEWMHTRIFSTGMLKGAQYFRDKRTKEAFTVAKEMIKQIEDTRFEEDNEESFDNPVKDYEEQKAEYEDGVTFGSDVFDRLLCPEAKRGSLLRGDTTVLLAPSNVGKTTTMITVIRHNLFAGKKVLWLTHEGRPADLKLKLRCAIMDVSVGEYFELFKTPEGRQKIEVFNHFFHHFLTFVPLNKAGLTVEEVAAVIRKKQEERKAKDENGKGFDLLVDDYPAKLTTEQAKGGLMARRTQDEFIYNYFVQLALENKFHSLLAIQTNREGSRVNRHEKGEDRLLTMEDVMESWGPMTAATNVISINRDPVAEANGRVTFYICKSRSSEKGWAVCCKSNYKHSLTHSNELGATWYRGTSTMTNKLDEFLANYLNKPIPEGYAL